ncbi:MAG: galactokinase, partial [Bryobacterales bacterium]|nr:galactokinase [Bryobacterales bacterium]
MAFAARFGSAGPAPRVFRAPGRVNLIGEHTDYNDGFVMPAAIDLTTWAAAAPRPDQRIVVVSRTFNEEAELDPAGIAGPRPDGHWSNFVLGVARLLRGAGLPVGGANLMIESTVPLGSGLSSSAALEVAVAFALLGVSGLTADRLQVARLTQRAEQEYAGTRCGIMDQFTSCFGQAGHAMLLDCQSLTYRAAPLPPSTRLVVANTMVRHELAAGEYNARRADCEEAARIFNVPSLRAISPADFARRQGELPPEIRRRARHVITENARTVEAAAALERGDFTRLGELMAASHRSLRDDFEVSCPELDAMVGAARLEGVIGARMMGGGFGGCTINLVEAAASQEVMREMAFRYHLATGLEPQLYECVAVDGAG